MRRALALLTLAAALTLPASASAAAWVPAAAFAPLFQGPDMEMLPSGEVVVAWLNGGADPKVFAAIKPPGGTFGAPQVISEDSPDDVAMASNARGDVMVVWRDQDADGDIRAHFNLRPAGGTFAPEGTMFSPDGENTADNVVALDPQGNALAAWIRGPGDFKLFAAYRPAGGTFGGPDEISPDVSTRPQVAFEPDGEAVAVWKNSGVAPNPIRRALRPVGGPFGSEADLVADTPATAFRLAVDGSGNAVAAWSQDAGGGTTRVQAALKPAAADFGGATFVSPAGENHDISDVAADAQGNAVVTWSQQDPLQAQAAFRSAGGGFGGATVLSDGIASEPAAAFDGRGGSLFAWAQGQLAPRIRGVSRSPAGVLGPRLFVSPSGEAGAFVSEVGADAQGNGAALYIADTGPQNQVRVAGYDAIPPRIDAVTVPDRPGIGRSVAFSASVFDVWGPLTYTWRFGDGGTAGGRQVSHTYSGSPATSTVQLTVTDAAGQSATASRTLRTRDVTRPVLSRVRWTPAAFAAQTRRVRRGSRLRYRLSEAARVTARIQRRTVGSRVGRRCRRATRRLRNRRRCTRWVNVRGGTLRRRAKQGANSIRFSGKVRRRKLRTGRYRAELRAVDAAGLRSRARKARFRIVRRR